MHAEPATGRAPEILLVEDNVQDVVLTEEGFKQAAVAVNLHHVEDGLTCLAFLRKEEGFAEVPTPDLILLDLEMPGMDGRELLARIAADETLRHLPVVVYTTSAAERDVLGVYRLRCSSFVTKPLGFDELVRAMRTLYDYWFALVTLPPHA